MTRAISGLPRGTELRVRTEERISAIDRSAWDGLIDPDDLQATHAFVRTCEEARVADAQWRHVMVEDHLGPCAVASMCCVVVRLDLLSAGATRAAIRALRTLKPGFLCVPVVFAGLPVSFGQSCLRLRSDANPATIMPILARIAEDFAATTGAPVLCFKEFAEQEERVAAPLLRTGWLRAPSLPSCHMRTPWSTFEHYLASLRATYRRQVRADLTARARTGVAARVIDDWGPECPRICALYEQVMDRAPVQLERLTLPFFERLAANLPGNTRAIVLEHDGEALAAAVLLVAPRLVTFLLAGLDYRRNQQHHAYQNLVLEVVRETIRSRAAGLEMGQTSYALKGRLGAHVTSRALYLRAGSPVAQLLLRAGRGALFPSQVVPERRVFRRG